MKAAGAMGALAALGGVAVAGRHEDDDHPDPEQPDQMPEAGEAAVSVGHFSPDAPAVDIQLGDEMVAMGAEYGDVTDYINVQAGTHTVQVFEADTAVDPDGPDDPDDPDDTDDPTDSEDTDDPTDTDDPADDTAAEEREPLLEEEVTLEETFYTLAAVGEAGEDTLRTLVLEDYDVAQVRLVHASPDAPAVDVTVEDTNLTLFERVRFGEDTDYVTVPGGDYTLEVREARADQSGDVVDTFDVEVESGRAYSAYAAGYASEVAENGVEEDDDAEETVDDTERPPLELYLTIDGVTSLTAADPETPEDPTDPEDPDDPDDPTDPDDPEDSDDPTEPDDPDDPADPDDPDDPTEPDDPDDPTDPADDTPTDDNVTDDNVTDDNVTDDNVTDDNVTDDT